MRNINFAPNEYYHIFNHGSDGNNIFRDESDRIRFLFLILYFQSTLPFLNISQYTDRYLKKGSFCVNKEITDKFIKKRTVNLISYCLMDNHFHLIAHNVEDGALSIYMHRVLMGYSKYFNAKYKKKGHLFQGPFVAKHIKDNTQLLHASAYIHKNPRDIKEWEKSYFNYPYSSLVDFTKESRWGDLLKTDIILNQFKSKDDYRRFVDTSSAKEYLF